MDRTLRASDAFAWREYAEHPAICDAARNAAGNARLLSHCLRVPLCCPRLTECITRKSKVVHIDATKETIRAPPVTNLRTASPTVATPPGRGL